MPWTMMQPSAALAYLKDLPAFPLNLGAAFTLHVRKLKSLGECIASRRWGNCRPPWLLSTHSKWSSGEVDVGFIMLEADIRGFVARCHVRRPGSCIRHRLLLWPLEGLRTNPKSKPLTLKLFHFHSQSIVRFTFLGCKSYPCTNHSP